MTDRREDGAATPAARGGFGRFGRLAERAFNGIAAVILFLLMLLSFIDVVGRDVFDAPLPGGFEITEIMMAALIFIALPVVSRRQDHVVIDLLDGVTPAAVVRYRQVAVNLIGALVLGVIAWRTWGLGVDLMGYKEVTEYLQVPVGPIIFLIAILSGIAALTHIGNAWRHWRGEATGHETMSSV